MTVIATLCFGSAPVTARCIPGRSSHVEWDPFGSWGGVNPGVRFYEIAATLENTAIPYLPIGAGETHSHVELRDTSAPSQPDGGARIFVALKYSSQQGRLSSTGVRVFVEDEDGTGVLWDETHPISEYSLDEQQIEHPRLLIEETYPFADWFENYYAEINDTPIWPYGSARFTALNRS